MTPQTKQTGDINKDVPTIEEIVAEFKKKISSCTELEGFHDCVLKGYTNDMAYKKRAESWLTQTLKDYGDAVRAEERKQIALTAKRMSKNIDTNRPEFNLGYKQACSHIYKKEANNE